MAYLKHLGRPASRPLYAAVLMLSVAGLVTMFSVGLVAGASGSAAPGGPTAVLLGNAQRFALLAGSGLTNKLETTVTGDVGAGVPTPTETGFGDCTGPANCVVLTGANHVNDGVAFAGQSALTTAYNNAASRTPTQVGTQLGTTLLKAGVYNSASGTFQITGALTLDAQGDPDAVFIFQTASTLKTAVASSVSLVNGAQACNVFWKVGSAATLNASSRFVGTVMAHDDISLEDGVTVNGRLLAGAQANHAGAVTLIHDTITRPTCAAAPPTSSPPTTTAAPPTTQGSHGTSTAPGTGHTTSPGTGHTSTTGTATSPGTGGTGNTTIAPTGPQVTNTPSGPVGTGDSSAPGSGGGSGGAHYGLAALLLLAGTLCVVGVARLAQRSRR